MFLLCVSCGSWVSHTQVLHLATGECVGCLPCQERLARGGFRPAARPGRGAKPARDAPVLLCSLSWPPFSHTRALCPLCDQAPGARSAGMPDCAQQRRYQWGRGFSPQPRMRHHTGSPGGNERSEPGVGVPGCVPLGEGLGVLVVILPVGFVRPCLFWSGVAVKSARAKYTFPHQPIRKQVTPFPHLRWAAPLACL